MASNEVLPNPYVCAETLKACALIGLHLLAAEGEDGSSGSQFLDLGCPESEGFSSSEQYEHNVESVALNVMGQDQSGEKRSLFLEDWELATVALSRHIALDIVPGDA